jgi:hypothetical protein
MLLQAGHEVIGLDSDLYERCTFSQGGVICDVPTILKDARDVEVADFKGIEPSCILPHFSDPLGNLKPGLTDDINHRASVAHGGTRQEGRRRPVCFHILLQQLWEGGRRYD